MNRSDETGGADERRCVDADGMLPNGLVEVANGLLDTSLVNIFGCADSWLADEVSSVDLDDVRVNGLVDDRLLNILGCADSWRVDELCCVDGAVVKELGWTDSCSLTGFDVVNANGFEGCDVCWSGGLDAEGAPTDGVSPQTTHCSPSIE